MDLAQWLQTCRQFREQLLEIIRETDSAKHQQRLQDLLEEVIKYERILEIMLQAEEDHGRSNLE